MNKYAVDRRTGLLSGTRFVPSPNFDARPDGATPDVLIVHSISLPPGQYGGEEIEQFFCNRLDKSAHPYFAGICDLQVSAHLLIRRNGDVIQFVPLHERAWHAGESTCEGRSRVNDFSIGIELEGTDDSAFEDAQYDVLAQVTKAIMSAYPAIQASRLYGHSDIAPGRKTDPGPFFDWQRYRHKISV